MQPTPEARGPQERRSAGAPPGDAPAEKGRGQLFPYNTVVGVIDDPESLERAVQGLTAAGFAEADVDVLCGEGGIERIDATGKRKGLLARIFRLVDALGSEREHTERHVDELGAGHFVVVARTPDEAAKARARDALAAHGGHYINYYSRWTAEELVP